MKAILFKRTIALPMMDGWLYISRKGKHHQFLCEEGWKQ
jgi:predicted RNA binding protein YcfA (HicA-like mRNA interferase family)